MFRVMSHGLDTPEPRFPLVFVYFEDKFYISVIFMIIIMYQTRYIPHRSIQNRPDNPIFYRPCN